MVEYYRHNDEIARYAFSSKLTLGLRTVWAWDSYRELQLLLQRERPDLAHFHNILPLISPAAYYACRKAEVPAVQTLHNYRLLCPAANFYRDHHPCEDCLGKTLPWPGVLHACYQSSRAASGSVAAMLTVHRARSTWKQCVDVYIALTEFARRKFIQGGLPREKIVIKPNFVYADPGARTGRGEYALFVGRLSEEKGLRTLLSAWERLHSAIPLDIVGEGPLRAELEAEASRRGLSSISFKGRLPHDETLKAMKCARFLIVPSECYENFPMTIVEAFSCGVPAVTSRQGAVEEIVEDGRTGFHFRPGDAADLAEKVEWAWADPAKIEEMGRAARAEYEAKYTAQRNYQMLMDIYQRVLRPRPAA